MRASYNWLRSFLPELNLPPARAAELLTIRSFETAVTGTIAIDPAVVVAEIVAIDPHPRADSLRLVSVATGTGIVRVVCGAPDIDVGDRVPFAPPGARLRDEAGQQRTLRAVTIRGEHSPGMLASPRELGLGPWHTGLLHLPPDVPVGTALRQHLPNDTVLTAELTANRAHDCFCHRGLARELAALLGLTVRDVPLSGLPPAGDEWQIGLADPRLAPRYFGTVLTGVRLAPSPLWLQTRLYAAGLRPINNVVDITNYVMLEIGNPMHVFDAARLPGRRIAVRRARTGEHLTTLDGTARRLPPETPLITSDNQPVAIAGIIGGADSQVTTETSDLWLESANFNSYVIQQAAAALQLQTEGAQRWSKGIEPGRASDAARRAIQLLQEIAGATPVASYDAYPKPWPVRTITFDPTALTRVAGTAVAPNDARATLTALRCTVTPATSVWQVQVPSDRLDLELPHDLVEEVLRLRYEAIPARPLPLLPAAAAPPAVAWREVIRDLLVQFGFNETYTYSFEDEGTATVLRPDSTAHITVSNPIAPDQAHLVRSLVPNVLAQAISQKDETRHQQLFEIGHVFQPGDGGVVPGIIEEESLAAIVIGPWATTARLRGIIDQVYERLGLTARHSVVPSSAGAPVRWPSQQYHVTTNTADTPDGYWGLLDAAVRRRLKLPPAAVLEINLTRLIAQTVREEAYVFPALPAPARFQAISKFPPSYRDVSLLVPVGTRIEAVEEVMNRTGGQLLADSDLFDVYQTNEAISYAFRLKYQALDRTLTDAEVEALHQRICTALVDELNATIR